jgi:hypothetical protein
MQAACRIKTVQGHSAPGGAEVLRRKLCTPLLLPAPFSKNRQAAEAYVTSTSHGRWHTGSDSIQAQANTDLPWCGTWARGRVQVHREARETAQMLIIQLNGHGQPSTEEARVHPPAGRFQPEKGDIGSWATAPAHWQPSASDQQPPGARRTVSKAPLWMFSHLVLAGIQLLLPTGKLRLRG